MNDDLTSYEAPVKCLNCAYRGSAKLSTGTYVSEGACPVCCVKGQLRPDNDFRDEERERQSLRQ